MTHRCDHLGGSLVHRTHSLLDSMLKRTCRLADIYQLNATRRLEKDAASTITAIHCLLGEELQFHSGWIRGRQLEDIGRKKKLTSRIVSLTSVNDLHQQIRIITVTFRPFNI